MLAPVFDCSLCPRLCYFRSQNKLQYNTFFNAPVPSFGGLDASFLVVGLAPGLKGANKTGRPFTGDYAGLILYHSLFKHGFANGNYEQRIDDGFELINCRVTNAVRCVPPDNKPELSEINQCNKFLQAEIAEMKNLRVILALGLVSHGAVLKSFGQKMSSVKFAHGKTHKLTDEIILLNSYHTSRYNMNTGRLTQEMFDDIISQSNDLLIGS
jgi:uracil-DNA glycosylase family 4